LNDHNAEDSPEEEEQEKRKRKTVVCSFEFLTVISDVYGGTLERLIEEIEGRDEP
jgi:hypothetical protein